MFHRTITKPGKNAVEVQLESAEQESLLQNSNYIPKKSLVKLASTREPFPISVKQWQMCLARGQHHHRRWAGQLELWVSHLLLAHERQIADLLAKLMVVWAGTGTSKLRQQH